LGEPLSDLGTAAGIVVGASVVGALWFSDEVSVAIGTSDVACTGEDVACASFAAGMDLTKGYDAPVYFAE
jgi:hypothetical protein